VAGYIPRWYARPKTVIHPSTNRPIVRWPEIELTTIELQVRRPNHWTTEPPPAHVCVVQWHALGRAEQAKYYEMARKEKELHMQLHPGWSARDNYATHTKKKKKKMTKRDVITQQQQPLPHADVGLQSLTVKDDPGQPSMVQLMVLIYYKLFILTVMFVPLLGKLPGKKRQVVRCSYCLGSNRQRAAGSLVYMFNGTNSLHRISFQSHAWSSLAAMRNLFRSILTMLVKALSFIFASFCPATYMQIAVYAVATYLSVHHYGCR